MKKNKIIIILILLIYIKNCDYINTKNNCCDDNECTGEICLKGCGMTCCGARFFDLYQRSCTIIGGLIGGKISPMLKCLSMGRTVFGLCIEIAAPSLFLGLFGCGAAGLGVWGGCSYTVGKITGPMCRRLRRFKPKTLRILDSSNINFPEKYSMNMTVEYSLENGIHSSSLQFIKEINRGETKVYTYSKINDQESAYLFDYSNTGKTYNLTDSNCTVNTGVYEPLDEDFLNYLMDKMNITGPLVKDSEINCPKNFNNRCNLWKSSQNYSDDRVMDFIYIEKKENSEPQSIELYAESKLLIKISIDYFSPNGQIDYNNKFFESCDSCKNLNKCEDILNTNCGWCNQASRAYKIDERNKTFLNPEFPFKCETSNENDQWITDSNDCKCLKISKPEDIKGTNCGWCPSLKKAFIKDGVIPKFGFICPANEKEGNWISNYRDVKCLEANKCEDILNTGCGWCPSLNKAFVGDSNSAYGLNCTSNLENGQWTYKYEDCKCGNITKCEDIKGTNCGWCPSLKKAYIGSDLGPSFGLNCPISELGEGWIKNHIDCKCSEIKRCEDILNTKCGWCPSKNFAGLGTFEKPYSFDCPISDKGQWTYKYEDCKCGNITKCEDIKGTNCGWCNSSKKAMIGNYEGPLGTKCNHGVEEGQWIFKPQDCKCDSIKACHDILGTNCGWCDNLKKAYIGDENGPRGIKCDKWIYLIENCGIKEIE